MYKPTYLYIKEHDITRLKYFGKTTKLNPYSYNGSGKYWIKHITKHGKEHVKTLWVKLFTDASELTEFALFFSEEYDIVKSNKWANLKPENGIDGNVKSRKESTSNCLVCNKEFLTYIGSGKKFCCIQHANQYNNSKRPNPFNNPICIQKSVSTRKQKYIKENNPNYNKKNPKHSEYMKSIGFGKNKTDQHILNHKLSWIESTKDNPIRAKNWNVVLDGNIILIKNLKKFCRNNNINYLKLYKGYEVNGYKLIKDKP